VLNPNDARLDDPRLEMLARELYGATFPSRRYVDSRDWADLAPLERNYWKIGVARVVTLIGGLRTTEWNALTEKALSLYAGSLASRI
jgi:hypothetical protein